MTQKPSGFEILADVIRQHYDVGAIESIEQLPQAHQRRHRKLVVTTEMGTFLVKTYKTDAHILDALRFQHRLSSHLHGHGLPVALIQRAKDGKGIVELETWALELQRFIEAVPMRITTGTLAVSAKALGRMHRVCRDFPCPPRDARMWRFSEVPRASFAKLFDLAKQIGDENTATKYCNTIALFLHDAAEALSLEARSRFETGLIHGDWHGGNLLFDQEGLAAIIDLEFAGSGCYLEDLAYGISNLCIRTSSDADLLDLRTNTVLDYYQMYRSLSAYERLALPYAVGVKHVATVSYQLVQLGGRIAGLDAMEWMERLAAQCIWLSDRAHTYRGRK
ncbi:MAG: phosphotransferase [Nitrospiraceae bacterium]|nr:phosphotransferase [Nitrospiraceae bacterium]